MEDYQVRGTHDQSVLVNDLANSASAHPMIRVQARCGIVVHVIRERRRVIRRNKRQVGHYIIDNQSVIIIRRNRRQEKDEPLAAAVINVCNPLIRVDLSTGSVNHGLVKIPALRDAESVIPTRPREVTPVERYTVIEKTWLALYGYDVVTESKPGRTVP